MCFNDAFKYWIPKSFSSEIDEIIYINDELGKDIEELFENVKKAGSITNIHSREYGTSVYLCKKPRQSFNTFYAKRIKSI